MLYLPSLWVFSWHFLLLNKLSQRRVHPSHIREAELREEWSATLNRAHLNNHPFTSKGNVDILWNTLF